VYSAAGAVVASNIGGRVVMAAGGISNLSASVTLSAAVTNGYVVAEIFSGTNAASYVSPYAGGAYPLSLYALSTPLAYLTRSEADARYVLAVNGATINPTIGGALTFNGTTYTNIPEGGTAGAITNGGTYIGLSTRIGGWVISDGRIKSATWGDGLSINHESSTQLNVAGNGDFGGGGYAVPALSAHGNSTDSADLQRWYSYRYGPLVARIDHDGNFSTSGKVSAVSLQLYDIGTSAYRNVVLSNGVFVLQ